METRKPKVEITNADLKKLQKDLKKLDSGWVKSLEDEIKENEKNGTYSLVNDQKIYNVFNKRLKNGGWKLTVYKYGKQLLTKLETALTEVKAS